MMWDAKPAYSFEGQVLFRLRKPLLVCGDELGQELLDAGIDTRNDALPGGFEVIFYPPQTIGLPIRSVLGKEENAARIVNRHNPEIEFSDGKSTKDLSEAEIRNRIDKITEREQYPERAKVWDWEG